MPETTAVGAPAEQAPSSAERVLKLLNEYKIEILAVLVVFLAGLGLYGYVRHASVQAEKAAWNDIAEKMYNARRGNADNLGAWMNPLFAKHKNTEAVAYIYLLQAPSSFTQGKYDAAERLARDFLSAFPQHAMAPQMRLLLAKSLAEQNKRTDALDEIGRLLASKQGAYLKPDALLLKAECLQAEGNLDAARESFLTTSRGGEVRWPHFYGDTAAFGLYLVENRLRPEGAELPEALRVTADAEGADGADAGAAGIVPGNPLQGILPLPAADADTKTDADDPKPAATKPAAGDASKAAKAGPADADDAGAHDKAPEADAAAE